MSIFSPKKPKSTPPVRMPDQNDPALLEAKRQSQLQMSQRGGRDSTILSDNLTNQSGQL